ncbi:hypothetical protein HNY73_018816 [Argiope bruennichi]|uniref:Uncharacterized protein n=1 Tax=Argiope bruennichi TaxID=94029 RepID=A0A8T0EFI2_ARGBR|nr:hypothetical protein HNY73_018816 [Argiope bruennichi]
MPEGFGHTKKNSCRGLPLAVHNVLKLAMMTLHAQSPKNVFNCNGSHPAYSKSCPKWKIEKEIQTIKISRNISFAEARQIVEKRTPKENLPYSTALKRTTCSSMQTEPIEIQENSCPSQTIAKPFPSPSNEEYITIKLKDWLEIIKSSKSSITKEKNITKNQKTLKIVPQNKKKKKNLSIQNQNEQKEKINVNSKDVELEIHPSDESLSEMAPQGLTYYRPVRYNVSKANWPLFNSICQLTPDMIDETSIDLAVKLVTEHIIAAADISISQNIGKIPSYANRGGMIK